MGLFSDKCEGVVLSGDEVRYGREGGPIAGAHASVDAAGEIDRRITATRLILTGPFALAFRKKKDRRETYLLVEGDGFAFVVEVPSKKAKEAREFAAKINRAASKAKPASTASVAAPAAPSSVPAPPGAPAGWLTDPTGRHESRYWDGGRWTEHCADDGAQAVDPP